MSSAVDELTTTGVPVGARQVQAVSEQGRRRIRAALSDTLVESTRRAYSRHWRMFEQYCQVAGYQVLPADADVVCQYLHSMETGVLDKGDGTQQTGYSLAQIEQALAAIKYVHRAAVAIPASPPPGEPAAAPLWTHPRPRDFMIAMRNRTARSGRVTAHPDLA